MDLFAAHQVQVETALNEILPGFARIGPALQQAFVRVCSLSEFVFEQARRQPAMVEQLLCSGDLERAYSPDTYAGQLAGLVPETLDVALRRSRQREMVRIVFRDLSRRAGLWETTADLSNLADACIDAALRVHHAKNCARFGTPIGAASGQSQQMAVLALGKLGAGELNVSSDIDLIFLYDEAGMTHRATGEGISNQEFFLRTGRDVIASLDARSVDGFVFRVDMRLRPYGESGALILNSAGMEKYFLEQGRDWERYAFVKARACAGDMTLGEGFLKWLRPFVYRRHLDYGAVDALREMKRLVNLEVARKDMRDDVKLGPGGIREIEFIVQALQLIWGGRERQLQERRIKAAMALLAQDGFLPTDEVTVLRNSYEFLRNTEHVIQAERDRQTQALPKEALSQARLAEAMGYAAYDDYADALAQHRQAVIDIFARFMAANNAEHDALVEGNLYWTRLWRNPDLDETQDFLVNAGFADPAGVVRGLQALHEYIAARSLHEVGGERLDRLMPVLLGFVARETQPDRTLTRVLLIIEQIVRRSTYIAYLLENVDALKRMIHLCGMSPWVAERLKDLPILLYELSDRQIHEAGFHKQDLARELVELLAPIAEEDLEAQMDLLRQFKNAAVLKVAVFELLDVLPLMQASDALTVIAEVVLDQAVVLAWNNLVDKFGEPQGASGERRGCRLGVVAYGKLGGFELSYGSDLDLVLIHDADPRGVTDGARSVENSVFYHRLAQRVIHILSRYTQFGDVYDIDLRLRPSGAAGPLVTTLAAYERYLQEKAWTWELQALVRARFVAGSTALAEQFDLLRATILQQPRDRAALLAEVTGMREKMRQHLPGNTVTQTSGTDKAVDEVLVSGFDLKHGVGAMVDIEFMVQFAVLAESYHYPQLTRWTDKMRLLDELAQAGVLTDADRRLLQKAYLAYRSAVHYQWLGGEMASFEQLNAYRAQVVEIWQKTMAEPGDKRP